MPGGTDRLADLQGSVNSAPDDVVAIDIDLSAGEKGAQNEFMSDFFEEVGHIKSLMSQIRTNIKIIQDTYTKSTWGEVGSQDAPKAEALEELLRATNTAATKIRNKLKEMKLENDKCPADSSQKRIRTNMHSTLSKKFLDLMHEYQSIQTAYKDKFREKVQRAAEIVKPGITEEEVENLIHSDNTSNMFANQILNDPRHLAARNALVAIQQQNRDIKQLERSINELQQMFLDMSTVVDVQGEMLEQIGINVNQAVVSSGISINALEVAERSNKARKRRMLIFSILGVFLLILIGLGLAAALTNGGA